MIKAEKLSWLFVLTASVGLVLICTKAFTLYGEPKLHAQAYFWLRLLTHALVVSWKDLALVGVVGILAATVLSHSEKRYIDAAVFGTTICIFTAMIMISLINIEIIDKFGTTLSLGLVYYSDILGSENGRIAVASWIPKKVGLALGASMMVLVVALVSARSYVRKASPKTLKVAVAGLAGLISCATGLGLVKFPLSYSPAAWDSGGLAFIQSLRQLTLLDELAPAGPPPAVDAGHPARLSSPSLAKSERPIRNVILLVLESVSAQYLDIYGGPHAATPFLKGLLDHALLVRTAYSQAVASNISLVSILSSSYPWIGLRSITKDAPSARLDYLPERLRAAGLRTGFFHSSDTRHSGVDRLLSGVGFDVIQDYRHRNCSASFNDTTEFNSQATSDACTFQSMTDWVTASPARPFFAMLWTFQQHYPYFRTGPAKHHDLPDDAIAEYESRYLDAITEADAQIGKLVDVLRANGLLDSTLIVVTGDHGEAFRQHGSMGHGVSLFEEDVRVPLVFINNKLFEAQSTDRIAGHIDIGPSIVELLGIPSPTSWDGHSIFQESDEEPLYFFSGWTDFKVGYRWRDTKVVASLLADTTETYNLATDPEEQRPAAAPASERARIIAWIQKQNSKIHAALAGQTGESD